MIETRLNEIINGNQNKPVVPVTSWGPISNCFDPHGHSVSTTNKIKLLCGIFWTLNGLSQPDEWQLVNFPLSGELVFNRSGCKTNKSVFKSHGRVNVESGVILTVCVGCGAGGFGGSSCFSPFSLYKLIKLFTVL